MLLKLFLGFTIIPVIEIYFLIKIGALFGAWTTVLIVISTGILGAYLARMQGFRTMFKVRDSLNRGIMPAGELVDALLIVIAGVVLLTPGFLTDIIGFFLLIPATRSLFKKWLLGRFEHVHVQGASLTESPKNIN